MPLISLQVDTNNIISTLSLERIVETDNLSVEQNSETYSLANKVPIRFIVIVIYISITLFLFLRLCFNIRSLLRKRFKAEQLNYKEYIIYGLDENVKPFTFLHFIFISKTDWLTHPNKDELINHEIHHKNLKHSLDILFIELLKIIFWFNPVLFFYKTLIQENHEYEVDAAVLSNGLDARSYAHIIIDYTFIPKTTYNNLSSGFSHSLIKNRITMISKFKKNKTSFKQSLLMVALVALIFLSTAFTVDSSGFFFAEKITYSQKEHKLYLKGENIKVNFQDNEFLGKGTFSFLGEIDYLQINNKIVTHDTTIEISDKKCVIKQIDNNNILSKLGLDENAKAFEIITIEK